jgi:undecaprenyl-diphosphatase
MNIIQAVIFGIIEGLTEFLPVSSTGHLTIAESLMGFHINDPAVTAFTAIIQMGAVFATILYFRHDIARILTGWGRGIANPQKRDDPNYKFGWAVILGSIPIAVIGLAFKSYIETTLRSLWVIAFALIIWGAVMWLADRYARQTRSEADTTWRDTLFIGAVQCLALLPGVSRSGATMSAGLFRNFDRLAATRLAFFLAIPALLAAGTLEAVKEYHHISSGVGWGPTIIATITSFFVAYAAIAWLLKYVSGHNFTLFVLYRFGLGTLLIILLATGTIAAY